MQVGNQDSPWQYKAEADVNHPEQVYKRSSQQAVSWSASEYIAHDKSSGWFFLYGLASIGVLAVIFLLTRDWVSVVLLAVAAFAFGVFAGRRPSVLNYMIDNRGVHIGEKLYPINVFRSFSIIQEGAIRSLMLLPLKRFMPSITIYYAPEDEDKIIEAINSHLPFEERRQDPLDRFMHRIRF